MIRKSWLKPGNEQKTFFCYTVLLAVATIWTLIKEMKPMERLSIDFKGPLPSNTPDKYLPVIIDEHSRFPFVFPCRDMTTSTVIECLEKLFTLCGTTGFIHSDNGSAFISHEFTSYLLQKGISSSKSSIYHPCGNGQAE